MKNDSDVMDNIPSRPVGEQFNFRDVVVLEVVNNATNVWDAIFTVVSAIFLILAKLRVLDIARNLPLS